MTRRIATLISLVALFMSSAVTAVAVLHPIDPPVIVGGTSAVSASVEAQIGSAASDTPERVSGSDRYETAVEISKELAPAGALKVFVVSGENFPDALGVGPAASIGGHPILLTTADSLPTVTKDEVLRLAPNKIVIVGGTAVISSAVEAELASIAPTTRLAGANRYETAVKVSEAHFDSSANFVAVVSGTSFPDGLTVGAVAGYAGFPVLLTNGSSLTAASMAEIGRINPTFVVIVGGTAVVSDSVRTQLEDAGWSVQRFAGADRYETAAAVGAQWPSPPDIGFVASGESFPDALAVAPLAAKREGPILLTRATVLPDATRDLLELIYGTE